MKLYKHQRKQNKEFKEVLRDVNHVLFVAPTGYGKSVAMWDLIGNDLRKGLRVLVLAPRRTLVFQLEESFKIYRPHVIMGNIERGSKGSGLVLSSIQTANNRLRKDSSDFKDIDKIYIDEAHMGCNFPPPKRSRFTLLYTLYWDKAKWVGFTATPITGKGETLKGWDDVVSLYDVAYLIKKGYLSDFVYHAPNGIDVSQFAVGRDGEYSAESMKQLSNPSSIDTIVSKHNEVVNKRSKVLIFTANIEQAELLRGEIKGSMVIHSEMSDRDQRAVLNEFKYSKKATLINVNMLTTGFDEPSVNILIIARPIRTLRTAIQTWGRGLRKHGDKICDIYDMCSVCRTCVPSNLYVKDDKGNSRLAYADTKGFTLTPKSVFRWNCEYKADKVDAKDDIVMCDSAYSVEFDKLHPKKLKHLRKEHKRLKINASLKKWYNDDSIVIEMAHCMEDLNPRKLKRLKINHKDKIETTQYCYNCYNALKSSSLELGNEELILTDGSEESKGEAGVSVNVKRKKAIQDLFAKHTSYKKGYAHYVIQDARSGNYLDDIDMILNSDIKDSTKVNKIKKVHNGK